MSHLGLVANNKPELHGGRQVVHGEPESSSLQHSDQSRAGPGGALPDDPVARNDLQGLPRVQRDAGLWRKHSSDTNIKLQVFKDVNCLTCLL